MTEYWVDGYNLLFRQASFHQGSLRQQREALVEHVNEWVGASGWDVTLIFDAVTQYGDARRSQHDCLGIVFTGEGISADEHIVDELERLARPSDITVVTSDKHLAWHARNRGAKTESINGFMQRLRKRARKTEWKRIQRPLPTPPTQCKEEELQSPPPPRKPILKPNASTSATECYDYYLHTFEERLSTDEETAS